jgi:hypothetical protein
MPEKSLLIAIAKQEARRHRVCHASVRTLSLDAGCDEKTGRRVLERLEKKYRLIRVRKVRGATSHIVINWQRFKRFTETTPPKSGRGTSRTEPLPKVGVPPLPNLGVPTPPKIGSRGVKNPEGGGSGAVSSVFENTSGETVNHHHPKTDDDREKPDQEIQGRNAAVSNWMKANDLADPVWAEAAIAHVNDPDRRKTWNPHDPFAFWTKCLATLTPEDNEKIREQANLRFDLRQNVGAGKVFTHDVH